MRQFLPRGLTQSSFSTISFTLQIHPFPTYLFRWEEELFDIYPLGKKEPLRSLHFLFERLLGMKPDDEKRGLLPQYLAAEELVC